MKKIFLFPILLLMACFEKQSPPLITGLEGMSMPTFNFLLLDSTTRVSARSLKPGKPIVMFYFSPYCPYCKAQTKDIIDHISSFKNIEILFVSNFPFSSIKTYYEHYQLRKYSNISIGIDYKDNISAYFKPPGVPYIAIYDKYKKLTKVYVGRVKMEEIKKIAFG
jgi:protein-disulfide isomerase